MNQIQVWRKIDNFFRFISVFGCAAFFGFWQNSFSAGFAMLFFCNVFVRFYEED